MTRPSLSRPLPEVWRWNCHSPEHRCDLASHAVRAGGRLVVFDPIEVDLEEVRREAGRPDAIVLTNGNHERTATSWRDSFGAPILGLAGVAWALNDIVPVKPGTTPVPGWEIREIPGGAPGETVWLAPALSVAVFGDSVINLADRRLEILPAKYCEDPVQLRVSLRGLLESVSFEHALFAHGEPLMGQASRRIQQLLAGEP